jgi:hypothetical protein
MRPRQAAISTRWHHRLSACLLAGTFGCESLSELAVVREGRLVLVANTSALFLVEGASRSEVAILLARDTSGAALAEEGTTVDRLELPNEETCVVTRFGRQDGRVEVLGTQTEPSTLRSCDRSLLAPCELRCGAVVWLLGHSDR